MFSSPRRFTRFQTWLMCIAALALVTKTVSIAQSAPEPPPATLPRAELSRLRLAVLPDLTRAVATFQNDPHPTGVNDEWNQCKVTPIRLGTLGPAVVVEWNPVKAPNANMINIYLPRNGNYRLLLAGAGFGPTVLAGSNPVPDLIFGGTAGVCHATYSRYRYQNEHYEVDACDQQTEGKDGSCDITSCEHRKLPTFPNPFPEQ